MNTATSLTTYTIKETSKLTGLPASTLRYYESIGIIEPIKRDESSKQRVYSEDDLNTLTAVSCLSATGMSIDDMRAYLGNRSKGTSAAEEQVALLESQKQHLAIEEEQIKIRRAYIELKIEYWQAVTAGDEDKKESIAKQAAVLAKQLKK